MKIVDMKRSDTGGEGDGGEMGPSRPDYPYGLCLYLDKETMDQLGISELPKPGAKFNIAGIAEVTGVSMRKGKDSKGVETEYSSTDLQIVKLGVDEQANVKALADKMYPDQG